MFLHLLLSICVAYCLKIDLCFIFFWFFYYCVYQCFLNSGAIKLWQILNNEYSSYWCLFFVLVLPFSIFRSITSTAKTRPLCRRTAVNRLGNLPGNVIDLIVEHLLVHDVARMNGGMYRMQPNLVLDDLFFEQLLSKKGSEKNKQAQVSEISRTMSNILSVHTGPILSSIFSFL